MLFMTASDRSLASAISELAVCNPFLSDRVEAERKALGRQFVGRGSVCQARPAPLASNPNLDALSERASALADRLRERLGQGVDPGPDRSLYEDLVIYLLYQRAQPALYELITTDSAAAAQVPFFSSFSRQVQRYLNLPALGAPPDAGQLFALFFQVRRAFHFTNENILGGSLPAARLRAAVWQAIFTHDMRRYRRGLYQRMHDLTTLIIGPTGTGKELVAQAIGLSRYIPFKATEQRFTEDFRGSFFAVNLAALPPTLIESELFGHRRGSFTGAAADRQGWLETCPPLGTVFLDEIAEIETTIQVRLLRVLQSRAFQRVGETQDRRFEGKIVAATNRDLAGDMLAGRFRPDLYYRLCSDVIETPALDAQLRERPGELGNLLRFIAGRVAGEEEADSLAREAEAWISRNLGPDYSWPGNLRELEQCVRNVMVRGQYWPRLAGPSSARLKQELARDMEAGMLTADDLVRRYCTLTYARTRNYVETARQLRLDRRTVKEKIDRRLLERLVQTESWQGVTHHVAHKDGGEA